jgi:hypothetical protein
MNFLARDTGEPVSSVRLFMTLLMPFPDKTMALQLLKFVLRVVASPPLSQIIHARTNPTPDINHDDDLIE